MPYSVKNYALCYRRVSLLFFTVSLNLPPITLWQAFRGAKMRLINLSVSNQTDGGEKREKEKKGTESQDEERLLKASWLADWLAA